MSALDTSITVRVQPLPLSARTVSSGEKLASDILWLNIRSLAEHPLFGSALRMWVGRSGTLLHPALVLLYSFPCVTVLLVPQYGTATDV